MFHNVWQIEIYPQDLNWATRYPVIETIECLDRLQNTGTDLLPDYFIFLFIKRTVL